jgi:twitching motility two-component system response regulator PilG
MQGELTEIDVRSILQLVELGQRTGQLLVQTYGPVGDRHSATSLSLGRVGQASQGPGGPIAVTATWFVFFVNGQIVYAGNPAVGMARLQGITQRYRLKLDWPALTLGEGVRRNAPEYGCLWALIEQRLLAPPQARDILETMVRETLFELLSLHQGTFMVEMGAPLTPQLMSFPITPLVTDVAKQVQEWKQFYPHVQSPDQCPVILDEAALQKALPASTVNALVHYADRQMSLRQLAYALSRDVVAVARAIYPCVQRGWVSFGSLDRALPRPLQPATPALSGNRRIVCIDDAVTIGQMVLRMLQPHGYEVTAIADPIQALTQVFQIQPHLILCDIEMPHLNGYEISAMLRQSSQFHQVPIVMLTGKDGFIDRVRAKMVGATDYLAKPFSEEELMMLIEQYATVPIQFNSIGN